MNRSMLQYKVMVHISSTGTNKYFVLSQWPDVCENISIMRSNETISIDLFFSASLFQVLTRHVTFLFLLPIRHLLFLINLRENEECETKLHLSRYSP